MKSITKIETNSTGINVEFGDGYRGAFYCFASAEDAKWFNDLVILVNGGKYDASAVGGAATFAKLQKDSRWDY